MAALRAGAGLVTVGAPKSLASILTRYFRESMWLSLPETHSGSLGLSASKVAIRFLKGQDVLAIGPGLSRAPGTMSFVRKVVLNAQKPVVIDADALAAFWGRTRLLKKLKTRAILTPHPGEFRSLTGMLPKTGRQRIEAAKKSAKIWEAVVVLKGHRTVVGGPDARVYVNNTGNAGMATAGSGDVLTGIIAAFLGQGLPPFEAAAAAVYVHGSAGDLAARKVGRISLVASDILEALPQAIKSIAGS